MDIGHVLPGVAYYNMSDAEDISLWVQVKQAVVPDRAHLRLILHDASHCESHCADVHGQALENYYSFHQILGVAGGWAQIKVQLNGSDEDSAPFVRKDWSGQVGNRRLDKDKLKGFRLELRIDGSGEINSTTSGIVLFSNMSATERVEKQKAPTSAETDRSASVFVVEN